MSETSQRSLVTILDTLKKINEADYSASERNGLVLQLRETLSRVETPWQRIQALVWEDSGHAAALKIAHDIGLFQNWIEDGIGLASFEQLSKLVKRPCDPALLDRVLRALAYKRTLDSPETNKYSLTAFSKALGEPMMAPCLDYWFDFQIPALSNLPSFLMSTSHQLPSDTSRTAWNQATNDPSPFFAWLQQRPQKMAIFGQVMTTYSASQIPWVDLYPAQKLLEGYETAVATAKVAAHPLVVDVGGGQGHDLHKFVQKYQPPKDSCYLQDQPDVIGKALPHEAVVTKSIDFFKESPVNGARAYYLHSVLHDWSDDQCKQILTNVKNAMDKTTSRILIHELIRLEDSANDLTSLGEFTVMAILGAPERSEKQWRDLVESVGLQVEQVYSNRLSTHSILEVKIREC